MLLLCCDRLKNERKRFKLTQLKMASLLEVSDMTVKRWESGTPIPSDKLEMLAVIGFDVAYIITGKQTQDSLSNDESLILEKFRQADASTKNKLLMLLLGGDDRNSNSQVFHGSVGQVNKIDKNEGGFTQHIGSFIKK